MMKHFKRPLAILALAALAACNGGTGSTVPPVSYASPKPGTLSTTGVALAGVGDSLTAGYQSSGFLGVASTSTLSAYTGNAVYPGQDNGFWAIMFDCLASTGATCNHTPFSTTNPSLAVLPLITAPGLADQLVLNATSLFASVQSSCSTFNLNAYSSSNWKTTRVNPTAAITDLGVPGITMHEALTMSAPLTGAPPGAPNSCAYPTSPNDPTAGGLQSLVQGESAMFYPVLGGYQSTFPSNSLTEVNVAVAMKPKLVTVWLGANDLLKYIFSNAQSPVTDTPTQMATDLTSIVTQLKATGAKVLVADLPTVLTTPQFFPVATTANPNKLTFDFAELLELNGVPAADAPTYAADITSYLASTYMGGATTGWYLTETGFLTTVEEAGAAITANPAAPAFSTYINLNASGLGAGEAYITPTFAAQITALNAGYNTAIDEVAAGSGSSVALVPIDAIFNALAQPGANLNALPAPFTIAGAPSATLAFGGGLVSWDGLHPSNLGYAVIADAFIQTADTAFSMTIPPLSGAQLSGIAAAADPYNPTAVNAQLPAPVFPLP